MGAPVRLLVKGAMVDLVVVKSVSDALVVGSSLAAAAVILAAARRPRRRGIADVLGRPVLDKARAWTKCRSEEGRTVIVASSWFRGEWRCCLIGCGGWSCVLRCRRPGGKRYYAFKVMRGFEQLFLEGEMPSRPVDHRLASRMARVAGVLEKTEHPHVIRLVAHGTYRGVVIHAYEYAEQASLGQQLRAGWRPGEKTVALMGAQLAHALAALHSQGVIHGDVKPGNILFTQGVAKLSDPALEAGRCTPGYCPPEHYRPDRLASMEARGLLDRYDVYQLASTLLTAATGESLDGSDAMDPRVVEERLSRVRSRSLRAVLKRMLSPRPEERPPASEAAELLYRASE